LKTVLGIHAVSHDAGAALASNGRVFAIAEERLSRVKYAGGLPGRSMKYVLATAGKSIQDVDLIVFDHIERNEKQVREWLKKKWRYSGDVHAIKHHDAHAAGAFYASPFDDAAVLVVDAFGSRAEDIETGKSRNSISVMHPDLFELQSFYRAGETGITLIRRTYSTPEYQIGIGILYALTSAILGFGELGGGKTMGLAPFGGKKNVFPNSIFQNMNGNIIARGLPEKAPLLAENFEAYAKWMFKARTRAPQDRITNRHAEIAAYAQRETQKVMLELASHLGDVTESPNLCLSGGVALNSVANKLILDAGLFENVFVMPAASDAGIPLGCALYGLHMLLGEPRFKKTENFFFGIPYTETEIESALKRAKGVKVSRPGNFAGRCAELLADGKAIGWFRGGSELGPRALGHRSIVADPRNPDMKARLNSEIKHRESYRPYAPSVLEEKASEYFEMDRPSPFMTFVAKARDEVRKQIPAVLHVDGTARLQTVNRNADPAFYELIAAFERITGVPMILNTSFNDAGEPIVETPADAIELFLRTGLDFLAIEDFLIEKK